MSFGVHSLDIDVVREAERIVEFLGHCVHTVYRRSGIVVGMSGGIDSAVMAELSWRAIGKENVLGLVLPERESNPSSSEYAVAHAKKMGIEYRVKDITKTVESVMSYAERDAYVKSLVPEYTEGSRYHIALPTDLLERDSFNVYVLKVETPDGTIHKKRLGTQEFRRVTSFANIKIRARMLHLYHEAERLGYVVAGTTNRTEYLLGDFCKYGDGGTDIEALAHLYKNQVYQLGRHLGVPREILERTPSPDTFSLPVSDQEFFFRIPFDKLDHLLYAWERGIGVEETAEALGVGLDAVKRAFADFASKNRATAHLRVMPYSLEA
ncbi:MAG TPA: NAD(+) synthase [Deltaproteobacteria bacterium]|nr:NAD(+) synthase [Deltaproteobacteria bacterium]